MNLAHALGPGLVAVACATATVAYAMRPDPVAPPPPVVTTSTSLLDDLAVDDKVAGWLVVEIVPVPPDGIDVRFERDTLSFVLSIVPKTATTANPPFASETHAIFYGHAKPTDAAIPAGALRAIAAELIRRLDRSQRP